MPYYPPPGGAIAVGDPVSGGINSTVLFVDAAGNVASSANLAYDDAAGQLSVSARVVSPEIQPGAGAAATPSLRFGGDPDTGLFAPGGNILGMSTGGVQRASIDGSGNLVVDAGGTFRWPDGAAATPSCRNATEASGMFRRAAGELNFSRAGTEVIRISPNGFQIRQGRFSNGVAGNEVATVGAAGGAAALPATPLGYLQFLNSAGAVINIPYYNP